jgi:hypothetical protein
MSNHDALRTRNVIFSGGKVGFLISFSYAILFYCLLMLFSYSTLVFLCAGVQYVPWGQFAQPECENETRRCV